MNTKFINSVMELAISEQELPFSVYTAKEEQKLHNVPFVKPTLVCVLQGQKCVGENGDLVCNSGNYLFLSNSARTQIRNIPILNGYLALLVEFEHSDFSEITVDRPSPENYFVGKMESSLTSCIEQFVDSSRWAPKELWHLRRKEILMLLACQGYADVLASASHPKLSQRVHDCLMSSLDSDTGFETICQRLAMSESTARRQLRDEGITFQEIKDQTRLGFALHLLQTTRISIGMIAEKCGYHSQSRFTERFKSRFRVTPSELRAS